MLPVVWDMETNDPDDFLTLIFLLGHPQVNLKAVTVTPGSPQQIGLVKKALSWFEVDIPVGSYSINHPKACVSRWHYKVYGTAIPCRDSLPGWQVLQQNCDEETIIITGAPLSNLRMAISQGGITARKLVAQGGFAGEGVVPHHLQLKQFKGHAFFPTFNFNGDPKAVFAVLSEKKIREKYLVSKNVCHRVFYDKEMHKIFTQIYKNSKSLSLIWKGMESYLKKKPLGKKFHDPLAACCAIDSSIGVWEEVEVFRQDGGWGSRKKEGSGVNIIVDYDHNKFVEILTKI